MKTLITILLAVVIIGLLGLLFAFPFMWIWNFAVVKAITVANPISYWTAYLLALFFGFFRLDINKA